MELHAFVVLPDYVHLLISPLPDLDGKFFRLATILNAIKGSSAHSINREMGRTGHLWQDESLDRVVRSSAEFDARMLYIIANPVNHGLVGNPNYYRWLWRESTQPGAAVPRSSL